MERLLNKVAKLREKTRQYGDEVSRLLGISTDVSDPRNGCFGMVFNHVTLTIELLSHYYSKWSNVPVKVSVEETARRKKENAERCLAISSWLFIASMSSIEYSTKVSIAFYGESSPANSLIKPRWGQRVYLSDIMCNSKDFGLIGNNEYDDWQNLIFLRNCIVHNNALSDSDKVIDIGGTRVEASAGKMFKGKLDCYAIFTEVAIERYFAWVKALIKEYSN